MSKPSEHPIESSIEFATLPEADAVPLAYPVPFRFERSQAPRYGLTNASLERLTGVTFALLGAGTMPLQVPLSMPPGTTAWIPIRRGDLARSTLLVVRWFRANGDEYLWRTSF